MNKIELKTITIDSQNTVNNNSSVFDQKITLSPTVELDKTLEDLGKETPILSQYIIDQCNKTPKSHCCTTITKVSLYAGWVIGTMGVIGATTISLLNLNSGLPLANVVWITAGIGTSLNVIAYTIGSITTGCLPQEESHQANKKQNSRHKLEDHFTQLTFRLINLYFSDEKGKSAVIELATKIHKNITIIKDTFTYKMGQKASNTILSDFAWSIKYLSCSTKDEQNRTLSECPNQDLLERIQTKILLSQLQKKNN